MTRAHDCGADGWLVAIQNRIVAVFLVSAGKLIEWVESRNSIYLALLPGRSKERQVTMKAALPMNNPTIALHDPYSCQPHEECDPPMPLESCCPRCNGQLELVQPDVKRSDALLGVCSRCPAWFLIDACSGAVIDLDLADRLSSSSLTAMAD